MSTTDNANTIESLMEKDGFIMARPDLEALESQKTPSHFFHTHHTIEVDRAARPGNIAAAAPAGEVGRVAPMQRLDDLMSEDLEEDIVAVMKFLNWHMGRINQQIIGRRDIIEQAFYAILTGEHLLLMSRTGMAKSYMANHIFNCFENVRIFATQASKDQTPDNYFGPYNIEEFKKGRIRHQIRGSIVESNLVFLDEFFDASDIVLRSLLSVLNERKFINGEEHIDAPIHSAIATANYMRLNEVTEAVLDRFIYKSIIPEDNNTYNQFMIDQSYIQNRGKVRDTDRRTPFEKVRFIHSIVKNLHPEFRVIFPDHVSYMKNIIINKYVDLMRRYQPGFFVSPRKAAKVIDFLRAAALMHQRMEVKMEDIKMLYLPLCTLNSFVSMENPRKSEKDLLLVAYEETMRHFTTSGALQQVELLLGIRNFFNEARGNPEKMEQLKEPTGVLANLKNLLHLIFPRKERDDAALTVKHLWQSVIDLPPATEEVRELREGLITDFRDMMTM